MKKDKVVQEVCIFVSFLGLRVRAERQRKQDERAVKMKSQNAKGRIREFANQPQDWPYNP